MFTYLFHLLQDIVNMKAKTFASARDFNETLSMEPFSLHESIKGKKHIQLMSLFKEIPDKGRLKRDDSLSLESSEKQCLSEGILECKLLLLQIQKHLNKRGNLDIATNIVKHKNKLKATCEKLEKKGNVKTDDESFIRMHDPESIHLHGKKYDMKMVNAEGIPRKELGGLLRLRVLQYHTYYLYPLSRSMSNEMMRFSSLSTFPRHINISMTRLARAGFFFTGEGCATKCYSCGTTYDQWKSGDDPSAIHKSISPSCILVNNFGCEIPPFEGDSYLVRTPPKDASTSMNVGVHDKNHQQSQGTASSPRDAYTGHKITTVNAISVQSSHASTGNAARNIPTSDITGETGDDSKNNSRTNDCQHDYASLGITIDKPKYPDYAALQVRISSYQGWPSYLDQTPREMAVSGFFFAGYHDYTRCFFCGGGLRNWELGDDPWVEHARWFPQCSFLKQNKGDVFVNDMQRRKQQLENTTQQNNLQSLSAEVSGSRSTQTSTDIDTYPLLDSFAVKSVCEMGYTKEQVVKPLQIIKDSGQELTAHNILQILLDREDAIRFNTSPSTQATESVAAPSTLSPSTLNLRDEAEKILEENQQLKEQRLCKVCLDLDVSIAFLPCGHIVCCKDCAPAMRNCPICRKYIKGTVKTYLA
ncbi:baculoviral IAP repeat-containing protein 7-like isoform X1 [Mytilus galloprovincialis]|uniref:baculoviral IAP repeat-containing protein 7-like isoform X1 n=2 Tax=Mytilus galloprovincialis TaxID=29158 RepID=UPI003F7C0948